MTKDLCVKFARRINSRFLFIDWNFRYCDLSDNKQALIRWLQITSSHRGHLRAEAKSHKLSNNQHADREHEVDVSPAAPGADSCPGYPAAMKPRVQRAEF